MTTASTNQANELIASLKDNHVDRLIVAQELGKLGEPAVEPLIAALQDSGSRWAALTALGMIGAPQAIEAISKYCKDADPTNRGAAVMALGKIGGVEVATAMIEVIKTEPGDIVRQEAIRILGEAGGPEAYKILNDLVEDTQRNQYDRRAATKAMGVLGGKEASIALKKLADQDPDEYVRKFASEALE